MSKEKLRHEVYEIIWSVLRQQLSKHISINEDPEFDKLENIEEK